MNQVPEGARGAKNSASPDLPTPAQEAFLEDVNRVEQLIRQGARVARGRRGTPEQVVIAYIVEAMRGGLRFAKLARAGGFRIETVKPLGWTTPYLQMSQPGPKDADVIQIEPYLVSRKGVRL